MAALFDLAVNARYARDLVNADWLYCDGSNTGEGPSLFYTFVKTCPRCSVKLGDRPSARSHKPTSAAIGMHSSDVAAVLLQFLAKVLDQEFQVLVAKDRQGDVDFVLHKTDLIALVEVKASPLVTYPIEIALPEPMLARKIETDDDGGGVVWKQSHTLSDVYTLNDPVSLYIPHHDLRIELGIPAGKGWPFTALCEYVSKPAGLEAILRAWIDIYAVFSRSPTTQASSNIKWLTFGCGGGVDDSKNRPGLGRTDDLKKGTYQVLKYGTYYKEKCPRRVVRAVLAGNIDPGRLFPEYLEEMVDIQWTKDRYVKRLDHSMMETIIDSVGLFNIYDALFSFTRSWVRDPDLQAPLNVAALAEALVEGRCDHIIARWTL